MSYENIVSVVNIEFGKAISSLLNDPKRAAKNLSDLTNLHRSKIVREKILSKLLSTFVNVIMTYIPSEFVNLAINNIRKNSVDKKPNGKFDLTFVLDSPIKTFVEYEILINDLPTSKQKVSFQLNIFVTMNNLEIKQEGDQKVIWLGNTTITLAPTLPSFEIMGIKSSIPISFGSKVITIDLSIFKIALS